MSDRVLILTTAAHYTPAQTLPFRQSLVDCGFTGTLVMLMEPRTIRQHRNQVADHVVLLPYTAPRSTYRKSVFRSTKRLLGRLLQPVLRALHRRQPRRAYQFASVFNHISINRNFYYYDYVAAHGDAYDWVIVTDCRDVLFQSDPGAVLSREHPDKAPVVAAGLEVDSSIIGQEKFTTRWIANAYGARMLDRLRGRRVTCSGAVYGTATAMREYLRVMSDALVDVTDQMGGRFGYDQGVHNVVVHEGKVPHLRFIQNLTSPIAHLGDMNETFLLSQWTDGRLRRTDTGEPVMLVHQYDRFPELTQRLMSAQNHAVR